MNAMVDYRLIGQRIRTHRRQAQLTQAELAELSGVCQQFIGCLERGKGIPSVATVMSLCLALSVDPNALLLGCARYDPEAPCTLRDLPTAFSNTLARLTLDGVSACIPSDCPWDPSAFPPYDITLEDGGPIAD